MKIKYSKILAKLIIFTMLLTILSPAALAVVEAPGFELPITVKLTGSPPTDDEDYKIILEADNPDYPMPDGSINGKYTQIIKGAGTVKLPKIEYSSLGVFTYTINQEAGSNRLASYDDSEYNLVVYVTNAGNESGLEITVILYLLGEEGKLDEVIFENDYDRETPPPPDRPDPPDRERPERPPRERPDPEPDPEPEVDDTIDIEEPVPEDIPEPVEDEEEIEEPIPEDTPEPPDVPKTGDDTVIWPYVGLFISGAALLATLGLTIKKREI